MKSYFIQFLAYSQQQLPYLAPTAPGFSTCCCFHLCSIGMSHWVFKYVPVPKRLCVCLLPCIGVPDISVLWFTLGSGSDSMAPSFPSSHPSPSDYTCFVFLSWFFLYLIAKLQEFGVWGYLQRHAALVRLMHGGCCCSLPDLREAREAVIV